MKSYGAEIHGHILCNDDMEKITAAIMKLKEEGADLIVCTGGMSVDPDDKTPGAIKNTGARIVSYGAPVLPGAMFLLSYLEDGTPVMGLPGCVMYAKATVFDLVLPRIIAGIEDRRNKHGKAYGRVGTGSTAGTYKSNRGNGNCTTFAGMWKSVGKGYDCRI